MKIEILYTMMIQKIVAQNYSDTSIFQNSQQGSAISMSYDGLTIAIGAPENDSGVGCVFVYVRKGIESQWIQQGNRIRGRGYTGNPKQGSSVTLSRDGNTLVSGGPENDRGIGKVWIFKRIENSWYESGNLIGPTPEDDEPSFDDPDYDYDTPLDPREVYTTTVPKYGSSVALFGDGTTIAIGAVNENWYNSSKYSKNMQIGAVYIARLTPDGTWKEMDRVVALTKNEGLKSRQGTSVALSYDGLTLGIGCFDRFGTQSSDIYVFKYSDNHIWKEQKLELLKDHKVFLSNDVEVGENISLSADGNTLIFGGYDRTKQMGCTWIFIKDQDKWIYDQMFLIGATGSRENVKFTHSSSLSEDGRFLVILVNSQEDGITSIHSKRKNNDKGIWEDMVNSPINLDQTLSLIGESLPISISISGNGLSFAFGIKSNNHNVGCTVSYTLDSIGSSGWTRSPVMIAQDFIGKPGQGSSVAISEDGQTMAIGGYRDNDGKGAVWIFYKSNGNISDSKWVDSNQKLTSASNFDMPLFGSTLAISKKGDVIAVGAPGEMLRIGGVYVFKKKNDMWYQDGKILQPENIGLQKYQFGISIAMSEPESGKENNRIISMGYLISNTKYGGIATFEYTSGIWKLFASITSNDDPQFANIGASVSLTDDGKLMACGCPGINYGCVIIFKRVTDVTPTGISDYWKQESGRIVGSGDSGYWKQGASICIDALGQTLAIGGPSYNGGTGCVWIFVYAHYQWHEMQKIVSTDGSQESLQGSSISLSSDGRNLVVGGPGDENNQGAVWCYKSTDQGWIQLGKKRIANLRKGNPKCGSSVALCINTNEIAYGGLDDDEGVGAVWIDKFSDVE